MGRIKQMMVKRTTKELLKQGLPFSESFEHDKKMLGSNTMPSKKVRNKIAGYLARLRRAEIKAAQAEALKQSQPKPAVIEQQYQ